MDELSDDGFVRIPAVSDLSVGLPESNPDEPFVSDVSSDCEPVLEVSNLGHVDDIYEGRVHAEYMLQAERLRTRGVLQLWERPMAWGLQLWERPALHNSAPPISAALALFRPVLPVSTAEQIDKVPDLVRPIVRFASRRLRTVKPKVDEDGMRQRALVKWRVILEQDLLCSTTGIMIAHMCENLDAEEEIAETINHVFTGKATATLYKRAGDVCKYLKWADNLSIDRPLLCPETTVYRYVKYLLETKAAATSAGSFVEALNFARGVIGLQCPDTAVKSPRVLGVVKLLKLSKRVLKQAEALTVSDLLILEDTCNAAPCIRDRVASGQFCFETYSSSRHSDANYVEQMHVDINDEGYGFLEGLTTQHKTATSAEKLTRFLPLIAPTVGVQYYSWGQRWLEAREAMGMKFGKGLPLLPSPDSKDGWTNRRLTAGEATAWLRDILLAGGSDPEHVARVSSHSCKATVLSWAAKRGLPISVRRLMGHHLPPGDVSAINYSRDAMSAPMQAVVDMLAEIRCGDFRPDDPRSKRIVSSERPFKRRCEASVTNTSAPIIAEDVGSSPDALSDVDEPFDSTQLSVSASSDEGSEDLGDDYLDEGLEDDTEVVRRFCPNMLVPSSVKLGLQFFQHPSSCILHYMAEGEVGTKFNCGRVWHSGYLKLDSLGTSLWPHCKQCKLAVE